ncbi:MAG: CDP-alcohol phosphatidyltransferase family protein [Paracoccaceae bacterium]
MKSVARKDMRLGQYGPTGFGLRAPVVEFLLAGAFGACVVVFASPLLISSSVSPFSALLVVAFFLGAIGLSGVALNRSYPHDRLGLCNYVTLARLVLVGVLAVALLERQTPGLAILTLAVLSLALDGVDGALARWEGRVSTFGARFDVEVDALFALLLAVYAAYVGIAAPYVVLLGLPYYLFRAAAWAFPWLSAPLPERLSRKAVCVAQIATLILLLVPGVPGWFVNGVVLGVIVALGWSFGRDILWLSRGRV